MSASTSRSDLTESAAEPYFPRSDDHGIELADRAMIELSAAAWRPLLIQHGLVEPGAPLSPRAFLTSSTNSDSADAVNALARPGAAAVPPVAAAAGAAAARADLVVGGVPEHFNAPWHIGRATGVFDKHGVTIEWRDVPEGTGAMCAGLRDGSLDVAVLLTEGIVRDLVASDAAQPYARVVATFVQSRLTWAVLAGPDSAGRIDCVDDLRGGRIGISRFGSGSHLMSFVLAQREGWCLSHADEAAAAVAATATAADASAHHAAASSPDLPEFVVHNNFAGLRAGVRIGQSDAFLWETFTTKPYCDSGELRRIGEVITPWPCFVVAVRAEVLANKWDQVKRMLSAVQESAHLFKSGGDASIDYVAEHYHLQRADAAAWFAGVQYAEEGAVARRVFARTLSLLIDSHILPPATAKFDLARLYDPRAQIQTVAPEHLFYEARLTNFLATRGVDVKNSAEDKKIDARELVSEDTLHYFGAAAVDEAAAALHLGAGHRVLEIGSAMGGTARYLAWRYQCAHVTAVEIKPVRSQLAEQITRRCGLQHVVKHVNADMVKFAPTKANRREHGEFDFVVSWLSILHIDRPGRAALFSNILSWLRPEGEVYIEDYIARSPLTQREVMDLTEAVDCPYVPSASEYIAQMTEAGFVEIKVVDITASWKAFVHKRLRAFEADRDEVVRVHGLEIYLGLHGFFFLINTLFEAGRLGGARITARRQHVVDMG